MRKLYETPTPGDKLRIPTKDDFIVWCENPVTQFVALAWSIGADLQKEDWIQKSWVAGKADPNELLICKTREDDYKAFLETTYEDYLKLVELKS